VTVTLLSQGGSDDGSGNTLQWTVDYDSTARTIGTTITTTGTCTQAELIVTVSGTVYLLDCLHGPAGNITNAGRVILGGPGSVIGRTNPINNLPVPPFGRGVPPPYEIDFAWHQ
jgi:hypothetical protein